MLQCHLPLTPHRSEPPISHLHETPPRRPSRDALPLHPLRRFLIPLEIFKIGKTKVPRCYHRHQPLSPLSCSLPFSSPPTNPARDMTSTRKKKNRVLTLILRLQPLQLLLAAPRHPTLRAPGTSIPRRRIRTVGTPGTPTCTSLILLSGITSHTTQDRRRLRRGLKRGEIFARGVAGDEGRGRGVCPHEFGS